MSDSRSPAQAASTDRPQVAGSSSDGARLARWQAKLLPLMARMVVGLTGFFFVASLGQLGYLEWSIGQTPSLTLREIAPPLVPREPLTFHESLALAVYQSTTALEVAALERRYHQATVLLMSRVWTHYLGFVTGMILALVGAAFILGRLQEPASQLGLNVDKIGALSFHSVSPGLILAALGVVLMIATIVTHHEITVTDNAIYLRNPAAAGSAAPTTSPPPLNPPQRGKELP